MQSTKSANYLRATQTKSGAGQGTVLNGSLLKQQDEMVSRGAIVKKKYAEDAWTLSQTLPTKRRYFSEGDDATDVALFNPVRPQKRTDSQIGTSDIELSFAQEDVVTANTQTNEAEVMSGSEQKKNDQQVRIISQPDITKTLMAQFQQLFSSMAASLEKSNTQMQEFQKLIEARLKKSSTATKVDNTTTPPNEVSIVNNDWKNKEEQTDKDAMNEPTKAKLLKDVGNFLAADSNQQKDMLKQVNESLGKIKPLERDSLMTATTGVMSALGNGISVKSAAKAGGAVLGVGIVGTLGGCLAYAAAKAATASTGAGATVKELGDALKETMEQVFPEALIAIAAAALLAVIAKMVYDAMQNAAKNINSTDTKTRLYKAQEKMQKAQNDLASNPLDLKAHKAMESAIKDMIDLGSQKVFTDKNGKKISNPQALLESDQLKSLKEALAKTTQLKNHAKLQVVYKLVHGDKKGAEDYKSSSKTQQFKNAFKSPQTNTDKLEKLAMKMNIKMSSASKAVAPPTPVVTTALKEKQTIAAQ